MEKDKKRKKMLFVYNPHSGRGEIGQALSDLLWRFTVSGYDVTVHPTSAHLDGRDYIAANAGEYDIVVSSGGDGMLHELFDGLLTSGAKVCCGYIPSGTVNDFASSLMISKNPIEAAETIVNAKFKAVDAGVFNGEIFSYVAAFGLFTNVSYSTDQNMKNALGFFAYLIEIIKNVDLKHFNESSVHASIRIEDHEYEDDYIFGYAGSTFSIGGMTNIIPAGARMDDGMLDFIFIKTPRTLPELDRIRQAFMTSNLDIPEIVCITASRAEIFTEREIEWTLDGEYGGKTDHAVIDVMNKAITIAVP